MGGKNQVQMLVGVPCQPSEYLFCQMGKHAEHGMFQLNDNVRTLLIEMHTLALNVQSILVAVGPVRARL